MANMRVAERAVVQRLPIGAGSLSGSLMERFRSLWPLKVLLLVGLTALFCIPYIFLAHHPYFAVHELPTLPPDRWTGFDRRWVWVYQSLYLLTGTLPGLATSREQLMRFFWGFMLLAGCSFAIFLFFPTQAPRPSDPAAGGMYGLLMSYDGAYNAFPSLHAGFLYYTLAFTRRVTRPPGWVSATAVLWALLILWATMATKEHYFIDIVAGLALAAASDAVVWSRASSRDAKLLGRQWGQFVE